MIDQTNILNCPHEPESGGMRFRNRALLNAHIEKHVLAPGEKWKNIQGFESEFLDAAAEGDSVSMERLALAYEEFLSETLMTLTREGKGHSHYFGAYPEDYCRFMGKSNPEPAQCIVALDKSKNLVIIAESYVTKGNFSAYTIKTGFRKSTDLTNEAWKKQHENRLKDRNIVKGKRYILIADHHG